ncbi:hypothetical protein CEY00_Acc03326 [Actinidia chinensis var. chinensis]|uniref:Uncharacterized protein n=1 Tax=Actinidia chinensis var. chinensis TaxID=1590841 RepID=A0A2R6RFI7_ACTCC|nr:hypothetical protein CEY00_Acc03326 [Actinidia chinensis var. chinensis]
MLHEWKDGRFLTAPQKYRSSKIFCILVFVIFAAQFELNAANGRLPWIVNPQEFKPSDIIVYPCTSNCQHGYCCYCNISKMPPICEKCCRKD